MPKNYYFNKHSFNQFKVIPSEDINQEVQRLKQQFEREIEQQENDSQVEIEKKKQKADVEIENYKRFLQSIENIREKLEEFYPNMPLAMVIVIHEYATQLLNQMWESSDDKEKLTYRKNLVEFLASVSEDTNLKVLESSHNSSTLPHRTLKCIKEKIK